MTVMSEFYALSLARRDTIYRERLTKARAAHRRVREVRALGKSSPSHPDLAWMCLSAKLKLSGARRELRVTRDQRDGAYSRVGIAPPTVRLGRR